MDEVSSKRTGILKDWKILLLLLSAAVISCGVTTKLSAPEDDSSRYYPHRRLLATKDETPIQQTTTVSITSKFNEKRSFLDPSWREWGDALVQFESLVSPAELDFTISRRMPWEQDESPEKCEEILLLMPEYFARNGHGSQMNSYVLAAMMATYLGKAMLVLDAPQKNTKYPNGSMVSMVCFSSPD